MDCCTELMSDVRANVMPIDWDIGSSRLPNENMMPSRMKFVINEAATMHQAKPPSGGTTSMTAILPVGTSAMRDSVGTRFDGIVCAVFERALMRFAASVGVGLAFCLRSNFGLLLLSVIESCCVFGLLVFCYCRTGFSYAGEVLFQQTNYSVGNNPIPIANINSYHFLVSPVAIDPISWINSTLTEIKLPSISTCNLIIYQINPYASVW